MPVILALDGLLIADEVLDVGVDSRVDHIFHITRPEPLNTQRNDLEFPETSMDALKL